MEIDEEVVFGGHSGHPFVEVDHYLVVAVHEIDLEALHAHLGIVLADALHFLVHRGVTGPQHDANAFTFSVFHQHWQVNFGNHLEEVGLLVHRPTFVQNYVLNTLIRGKVNVVFVGFVVDARLEIHAPDVPVVPPVPSHLAGLNPRDISHFRRFGKQIDEVVVCQVLILGGDGDHAPRERARAGGLGDVVLALFHHILQVVVPALLPPLRQRREIADHRVALSVLEVHAGVVVQVGLGDDGHTYMPVIQVAFPTGHKALLHQHGQKSKSVVGHVAEKRIHVGVFKRGAELFGKVTVFGWLSVDIRDKGFGLPT